MNVSKLDGILEAPYGIFFPEELEGIIKNAVTPENRE
jgi:hypothetical protein